VANAKRNNWVGIWKSIKKIDKDSNGFVTIDELDEIFREWFPLEMEDKTLNRFFRKKYGSVSNRNLINYKQLKLDIQ
jgi:Ca2+-binding EF-hand superfamily protein